MKSFDSKKDIPWHLATQLRRSGFVSIGFSVALTLAGAAFVGPATAAPPGARGDLPNLDHFRCYSVAGGHVYLPPFVFLRDQFDRRIDPDDKNPVTWVVGLPVGFCPPVQKTIYGPPGPDEITEINKPDHHLTMYEIHPIYDEEDPPIREVNWNVKVDNQFGRQTLFASKPVLLGVPTQKFWVGTESANPLHDPPLGLNHFKCYKAKGESVNVEATLLDQFEETQIIVREPIFFCNPTAKTFAGTTSGIEDPNAHLTCYNIDLATQIGVAALIPVGIVNQFHNIVPVFDTALNVVTDERMLCVPSLKVGVLATPGSLTSGS